MTDSFVFYSGLGACAPLHTCFTVSAAVGRRLPPFDVPVVSCMLVAFLQDRTVKHISRAMAPKPPQYRELRSLEAESLRSLATLRKLVWHAVELRGQRGGSRTLRVTRRAA